MINIKKHYLREIPILESIYLCALQTINIKKN